MERLTTVGRLFFATALIGLGGEHFLFREFVTGRAPPWPVWMPGETAWVYLSGLFLVATGIALVLDRRARAAAVAAAVLIFCWALLRHIPVVASASLLGPTWTSAGKALALSGGALAVAATRPPVLPGRGGRLVRVINSRRAFIVAGRVSLGAFLLITGIQHFMFTGFVAGLIPEWFPGDAVFWTYFGGVALIAGGLGLLVRRVAGLAALMSGLMVFSWFWIVHIPRTFFEVTDGIAVLEALAVAGIAFVLAGSHDGEPTDHAGRGIPGAWKRGGVPAAGGT